MYPLISIIIPFYNAKDYVGRCIDSVIRQTYKNIEIICVDDGSTDGSAELLDEWGLKDQRIIVVHQENCGVSSARNAGLDQATGDFLTFVDGDDYIEINALQSIMDAYDGKSDIVVLGFKIKCYSEKMKLIKTEVSHSIDVSIDHEELFSKYDYYRKYLHNSVWNKLFKREAIAKCRFDVTMKLAEDLYFCLEAYKNAQHFQFIDISVYHYMFITKQKSYMDKSLSIGIERNIDITNRLISLGWNKCNAEIMMHSDIINTSYVYLNELIKCAKYKDVKKTITFCLDNKQLLYSIGHRKKHTDCLNIKVIVLCCRLRSPIITFIVFKGINLITRRL